MDSSHPPIFTRTVSCDTFEQLCSLWRQMGNREGVVLAEERGLGEYEEPQQFLLLTSPGLSLWLWGVSKQEGLFYQIQISWDKQTIVDRLQQIPTTAARSHSWQDYLSILASITSAPPPIDFWLSLLNLVTPDYPEASDLAYPYVSVCQPVEDALRQQITQERLLTHTIAQIHQSLDLSVILETVVKEVRHFLEVDRLVIYQFNHQLMANQRARAWGKVVYESRASESIPSVLNLIAEDDCFTYIPHYQDRYLSGLVVAIEDVKKAYSSSFCLAQFLKEHQIKGKLIAPIVVQAKMWGLLIAHQCLTTRQWTDDEKNFLGQIAEHLAVAIYQGQLYAEVQQQKNTFEQRVIERTQELRDTLIAAQIASRAKSEFLSNISHELRTPLTNIIGLSSTLTNWIETSNKLSPEKQKKYLKSIQKSGKQLLELINDILDFSQLEAGKFFLKIRPISLAKIGQVVFKYIQEEARQKEINLQLDCRIINNKNNFYLDEERVQQILFQLLKNALKFTPNGGTVILRIWKDSDHAFFQVEDTGIGIAEQQLPLLFQTFQQLEESRKRTYGGTGLGLALTKQLVELHRGSIQVQSSLGKGSIFTVQLPNQSQLPLTTTPISQTESPSYREEKSIILIEQDEEIATLICELLTAATYQVVWLSDRATAIDQIELLQPHLLILEGEFPDVYHITQSLKRSRSTKSVKILLTIDQMTSQEWEEMAQQGVDDYLIKPIQPNLLLQRLETLISKKNR